ncbi:MAG: outer membrane protein assembly factor BamD [Deltaproteobacteria bacterium]|nr:outer membrane protein assembly factor BamD [Deltaproteobacteria bacterium]
MLLLCTSVFLIAVSDETAEMRNILELQYNQKVSALQNENVKLQTEMKNLKKELKERNASIEEHKGQPTEVKTKKISKAEKQEIAKKAYREALKDVDAERWDDAIVSMEAYARNFPESDFADHALYWIAQIYLQKNEIELARAELQRLLQLYPKGNRAKRARARLQGLPEPLIRGTSPEQKMSADSTTTGEKLK